MLYFYMFTLFYIMLNLRINMYIYKSGRGGTEWRILLLGALCWRVLVWHFSVCQFVCLSVCLSPCLSGCSRVGRQPPAPGRPTPGRPTLGDPPWATHPGRSPLGDPGWATQAGRPTQATHPSDPARATHPGRLTPLVLIALWRV